MYLYVPSGTYMYLHSQRHNHYYSIEKFRQVTIMMMMVMMVTMNMIMIMMVMMMMMVV